MDNNPWREMSLEEARAYDSRKENGAFSTQIAVKRELLWRIIKKNLPQDRDSTILDLGGGTGLWSIRLAFEGYRVILADISPGFLERAREKAAELSLTDRIIFAEADIVDLNRFDNNEFQLVLAVGDPLSYCSDIDRALAEIRRVTTENGVLIADVESKFGGLNERRVQKWDDVRRVLLDGIAYWPGTDSQIKLYSPSELRQIIESAGWEIISMEPTDLVACMLQANDSKIMSSSEIGTMIDEWVQLESVLRADENVLGFGTEILFTAKRRSDELVG